MFHIRLYVFLVFANNRGFRCDSIDSFTHFTCTMVTAHQ